MERKRPPGVNRFIPPPTNGFLDAFLPEPFQYHHPIVDELKQPELEKLEKKPLPIPSVSSSEVSQKQS